MACYDWSLLLTNEWKFLGLSCGSISPGIISQSIGKMIFFLTISNG